MSPSKPLRLAVIAGEHSGDRLGASLVAALRGRGLEIVLTGVGDTALARAGQASYFPQQDIAVMGVTAVVQRLPLLIRRIRETAARLIAEKPDIIVTVDSPDFNFRVAKAVRRHAPEIPIVHWVCPSVWAWRPGRAKTMRALFDHVLCLLPFEPDALQRLQGPAGTYVGHPLAEHAADLRPGTDEEAAARANTTSPHILVLPGSRRSIATRLLPIFRDVAERLHQQYPTAKFIVPTVAAVKPLVIETFAASRLPLDIVEGEANKLSAFRSARAALAASGTVTLELGLSQIPTVAAYKIAEWEAIIARRVIRVSSVLLPNLILGRNAVPEFLQEHCTADNLTQALQPLIAETPSRAKQIASFQKLDDAMSLRDTTPSEAAANTVLDVLRRKSPH